MGQALGIRARAAHQKLAPAQEPGCLRLRTSMLRRDLKLARAAIDIRTIDALLTGAAREARATGDELPGLSRPWAWTAPSSRQRARTALHDETP